ncbi:hypothetical protein EYF80_039055 [Liparis tanakae]|uniref:Uncharacterized protein n=1 Tax=Liparis tanakae TaxID=230148 RepID=A0A4Z2GDE0_9TELE|nr:hypothetical protein EYF80_039055 [Liparis tanakae]
MEPNWLGAGRIDSAPGSRSARPAPSRLGGGEMEVAASALEVTEVTAGSASRFRSCIKPSKVKGLQGNISEALAQRNEDGRERGPRRRMDAEGGDAKW